MAVVQVIQATCFKDSHLMHLIRLLVFLQPTLLFVVRFLISLSRVIKGQMLFLEITICDWACENRAYLHKIHMFRK